MTGPLEFQFSLQRNQDHHFITASDSSSIHITASDSSSIHTTASDSSSIHTTASDSSSIHITASDSSSIHITENLTPLAPAVKIRGSDYLQATNRPIRVLPLSDQQHDNRTSAAGVPTAQPQFWCQDITCSSHTPFSVSGHFLFCPHPIFCVRTLPVLCRPHSLCQDITCSTHTPFSVSGLHTIHPILCVRTLPVLCTPHTLYQDITCSMHTPFFVSGHYLFYPHPVLCIRTPHDHGLVHAGWQQTQWLMPSSICCTQCKTLAEMATGTQTQVHRSIHTACRTAFLFINWFILHLVLTFFFFFLCFVTATCLEAYCVSFFPHMVLVKYNISCHKLIHPI